MKIPFPEDKIQHFVVHFACRMTTKPQLSAAERKSLIGALNDAAPEYFQLTDEESPTKSGNLLEFACQYPVRAGTINFPSLLMDPNSVALLWPINIAGVRLSTAHSYDTSDLNQRMATWLLKIQQIIKGIHYQRAGKIFEMQLGPFNEGDKSQLLSRMFSSDLNFAEIGELNLNFAPYRKINSQLFNLQTRLWYLQQDLGAPFLLGLRIDINNRNLTRSMEPSDIQRVWSEADKVISDYLGNVVNL